MAAVQTARLLLRAELMTVKGRSPQHRGSRHRQSQPAPGIREQPRN
jgi:hypothetical protein